MNIRATLACLAVAAQATASDAPRGDAEAQRKAGEAYVRGVKLKDAEHWGDALAAFELADSLVHHPRSTYAIGACELLMAHHTRAREAFARALEDHRTRKFGTLLPQDERQALIFVAQSERALAHVSLRLSPAFAAVMVDGRPLAKRKTTTGSEWIANIEAPGVGKPLDDKEVSLVLDPGLHVFTFSRKGYRDVVRAETFSTGQEATRSYELERLPAVMHISSDRLNAVVTVDGLDVGTAPVSIERPAGHHRVLVRSRGHVPYQVSVTLGPGEQSNLRAALPEEKPNTLTRWWFWVTAGAVVAGVTAATYAVTRPAPSQAPINCGNTGWCASLP